MCFLYFGFGKFTTHIHYKGIFYCTKIKYINAKEYNHKKTLESRKMKITIYDVAKKADVSIATVSKVINNTGRISEATRKNVRNAMKELDYQPNMIASALMGKQTKTI